MFCPAERLRLSIKKHTPFLIFGIVGLVSALVTLPTYAAAFWPFSTDAGAASASVRPNSTTPVLIAPTNLDSRAGEGIVLPTSGDMALIAYSGPEGTLADVIDTPATDQISVYVVRPGDTLSDIANMFNVSINTIIWANNLKSAKDVQPGNTLVILPISGIKRVIVKGDTLKNLASTYGADATEIAQFNGLDESQGLSVGSTVIIPGGEVTVPKAVAKKQSGSTKTVRGSGGAALPAISGYFVNPAPGSHRTQGVHGHNGVDLGKAPGASIVAAAGGTVIIARNSGWNGGYGNYVVVRHNNGTQTLYAHLSSVIVAQGQSVSQGQLIGHMGSTGKSTGTHLHFEVRGAANPFGR